MSGFDISDTILAKSDQLNADDLISAPRRIKITGTTQGNADNPVSVNYEGDNGRPFLPCKTVRRILAAAWGAHTGSWVGKEALLYNDPSVVYAGKEVGGVRIKALSDIPKRMVIMLSKTRGKKVEHIIDILEPLELKEWPQPAFETTLKKWEAAIIEGKMTNEQAITTLEQNADLTDDQKQQIRDVGASESDLDIDESEFEGD